MYRARFFLMMIRCLLGRPRAMLDQYDLHFRALPFIDTDVKRLFTQSYALYMGLARWHYVFSSEFKNAAIKKAWAPVSTSEQITYMRAIKMWEKVIVRTQLICWDERRFYLKQDFLVNNELRAAALVEGLLRSPQGSLNPIETFKILGVQQASPEMPNEIKFWQQMRS